MLFILREYALPERKYLKLFSNIEKISPINLISLLKKMRIDYCIFIYVEMSDLKSHTGINNWQTFVAVETIVLRHETFEKMEQYLLFLWVFSA